MAISALFALSSTSRISTLLSAFMGLPLMLASSNKTSHLHWILGVSHLALDHWWNSRQLCRLLRRNRQRHRHCRELVRFRGDMNFAAVRLNDPLSDGEAETATVDLTAVRGIPTEEPVEDPSDVGGRDSGTRVAHGQPGRVVLDACRECHPPLRMIGFFRVVRE